jgi:hypothetical protein
VLLFGERHKYRIVDALVFAVITCDASDARPVNVDAVISPVATILGTRSAAPPASPGVYVRSVAVRRLVEPPFTSEKVTY